MFCYSHNWGCYHSCHCHCRCPHCHPPVYVQPCPPVIVVPQRPIPRPVPSRRSQIRRAVAQLGG